MRLLLPPAARTANAMLLRHNAPPLSHLTSLRGAFSGLGVPYEEDEEAVDTPMALGLPDPKAPRAAAGAAAAGFGQPGGPQLGINMPALVVPAAALQQQAGGRAGSVAGGSGAGAGDALLRAPEEVVVCFGIIDILQVRQRDVLHMRPCVAACVRAARATCLRHTASPPRVTACALS